MTRNHKIQEFNFVTINSSTDKKELERHNFLNNLKSYTAIFNGICRYENCKNKEEELGIPSEIGIRSASGYTSVLKIKGFSNIGFKCGVCINHIKEDFEIIKRLYPDVIPDDFNFDNFHWELNKFTDAVMEKQDYLKGNAKIGTFPLLVASLNDYFKKNPNQFSHSDFLEWCWFIDTSEDDPITDVLEADELLNDSEFNKFINADDIRKSEFLDKKAYPFVLPCSFLPWNYINDYELKKYIGDNEESGPDYIMINKNNGRTLGLELTGLPPLVWMIPRKDKLEKRFQGVYETHENSIDDVINFVNFMDKKISKKIVKYNGDGQEGKTKYRNVDEKAIVITLTYEASWHWIFLFSLFFNKKYEKDNIHIGNNKP